MCYFVGNFLKGFFMFRLIFLLLILSSCALFESSKTVYLTILHTNDHHGHYLPDSKGQIGMAARATLIKELRSEFKKEKIESLLLSGGDINTGTMESDYFDAEPDFKGMNKLGYDAMAVGNHEFDNSYDVILKQKKWGGFPFLSANIYFKGTNKRVFEPSYLIKKYKNIKIGIFGLTTKDTPYKASHVDAKEKFDFKPIIPEARKIVTILKEKESVDYIIVVTHVGHHGSLTSAGDIKLAKAVDGIDVIVGGHSQEIIKAQNHNNTIIVQAKDWGQYVGRLDLKLTKKKLEQKSYKLIPVNLKKKVNGKYEFVEAEIAQDKSMQNMFRAFEEKAKELGNVIAGKLDQDLSGDRKAVRMGQMPIAQFMGSALMEKAKDADMAVLNGGSIRSSLLAGDVTRKNIHSVHPYGNTVVTVTLTAKDLFDYVKEISKINLLARKVPQGGNPHYINAKMTFKNEVLSKIEAKDKSWQIYQDKNGKIHSTKKKYKLGTMNFLARGGDSYPVITTKPSYVDSGFMINSAMIEYIEKRKKINHSEFKKLSEGILLYK